MLREGRAPRSFALSATVASSAGLVVAISALTRFSVQPSLELAVLLVAALVSENFALQLPVFNVSLAFPLIVAAIVLAGPSGGVLVAAVCFTNFTELRDRRPLAPLAYNFGQLVLAAFVGGVVFERVGGTVLSSESGFTPLVASALPLTALASLVAGLCVFIVNVLLTANAVSLLRGHSFRGAIMAMLAYLPTQLTLALVGLLMGQVLAIDPFALPLFLFPLLVARQVYQQYEALQGAYLGTIRSLIGALEAKDPYTRGHSERVANYAAQIGQCLGWSSEEVEQLQTSALLHDVGKLAISPDVLAKPAALTDSEINMMRRHPEVGAGMVERIPPLRALAANVLMHHERIDGTGYPAGMREDGIPVAARILAVADAYDAMTTQRSYRDALSQECAFAELVAGSGIQFDAEIVRALLQCESAERRTIPAEAGIRL